MQLLLTAFTQLEMRLQVHRIYKPREDSSINLDQIWQVRDFPLGRMAGVLGKSQVQAQAASTTITISSMRSS